MGGTATNSNGGQFFISFGDYPALNGKYTIFGQVISGLDVLDSLSLLDLTSDAAQTTSTRHDRLRAHRPGANAHACALADTPVADATAAPSATP